MKGRPSIPPTGTHGNDVRSGVDCDLLCTQCTYNLRGLTPYLVCPECGQPVRETIRATLGGVASGAAELAQDLHETVLELAAARSGYPGDALLFVSDVIASSPGTGSSHVGARAICELLRGYALEYFNDAEEAAELLGEWKLHRSEDVGRVVYALVESGLLTDAPDDRPGDFDSLFSLDTLFRPPGGTGADRRADGDE